LLLVGGSGAVRPGYLQALSEVDLKLIALAYTLETQAHGTSHLRSKPPPLQVYFSLH
jgi:hypothetical protein